MVEEEKYLAKKIRGHADGDVGTVISVDDVARMASELSREGVDEASLAALANNTPLVKISGLCAGYGKMQILHGLDLQVAAGQSLCLIGPNGAGKSTILHSIYGFTNISAGSIHVDGEDCTRLKPNDKLKRAGIAYILQDNSVFPDMTVEENLYMGGYLMDNKSDVKAATERVFEKYGRLAERRKQPARVLSGGERRLLEISRALVMDPKVLLVDEPSIGLEPRFIDMVFEILADLQGEKVKPSLWWSRTPRRASNLPTWVTSWYPENWPRPEPEMIY